MKTAQPLTIPKPVLTALMGLARAAQTSAGCEQTLYRSISNLSAAQRAELLALYMLGHGGLRSFNVALDSAHNQPPERIAAMLAEKMNLVKCVNLGLKRHRRHS